MAVRTSASTLGLKLWLKEIYQELSEKDDELIEAKMELEQTKDKLNSVSTVLMNCQRDLHEKASRMWPW